MNVTHEDGKNDLLQKIATIGGPSFNSEKPTMLDSHLYQKSQFEKRVDDLDDEQEMLVTSDSEDSCSNLSE